MNVDVNLSSKTSKRKEKYKELLKTLAQSENTNKTLVKMSKTKECMYLREIDDIERVIAEKDKEIYEMEDKLIALKCRIEDTIDKEKIYSSNARHLFGSSKPDISFSIQHNKSIDSITNSNKQKVTPVRDNLISPHRINQNNSKPNLKFM